MTDFLERKGAVDMKKQTVWEKPELGQIDLDLSDIKNQFSIGSDGSSPGPPDTSMS